MSTSATAVAVGALALIATAAVGVSPTRHVHEPSERSLESMLETAFFTSDGISIATAGRRNVVAVAGRDTVEGQNRVRIFESGVSDGRAKELPAPFPGASRGHKIRVVRAGGSWCIGALSPSGEFLSACRAIGAQSPSGWKRLPRLPVPVTGSYDIAGTSRSLFVFSASSASGDIRAFRWGRGTWIRAGSVGDGGSPVVNSETLGGVPTVTITRLRAPRLRVLQITPSGEWRSLIPKEASRAFDRVRGGGATPNLGSAAMTLDGPAVGLSPWSKRFGFRFGVVHVRTGAFVRAPRAEQAFTSQGATFNLGGRHVVAIWKEVREGSTPAGARMRVLSAPLRRRGTWLSALAAPSELYDGAYQPANLAVIRHRHRWWVAHPEYTGSRIAYRLVGLKP